MIPDLPTRLDVAGTKVKNRARIKPNNPGTACYLAGVQERDEPLSANAFERIIADATPLRLPTQGSIAVLERDEDVLYAGFVIQDNPPIIVHRSEDGVLRFNSKPGFVGHFGRADIRYYQFKE